jgi:hypothetical protein
MPLTLVEFIEKDEIVEEELEEFERELEVTHQLFTHCLCHYLCPFAVLLS